MLPFITPSDISIDIRHYSYSFTQTITSMYAGDKGQTAVDNIEEAADISDNDK